MLKDDLVIEKLNINAYANESIDANALVHQLTAQLKDMVLPLFEEKIAERYPTLMVSEIELDRLEITLNVADVQENAHDIANKMAERLAIECEEKLTTQRRMQGLIAERTRQGLAAAELLENKKQLSDSDEMFGSEGDLINRLIQDKQHVIQYLVASFFNHSNSKPIHAIKSRNLSVQLVHFLKFGYFFNPTIGALSDKNITRHENAETNQSNSEIQNDLNLNKMSSLLLKLEENLTKSSEKKALLINLAAFLSKNTNFISRFLNQFSLKFQFGLWSTFMSDELAEIFAEVLLKTDKNVRNSQFIVQKCLEIFVNGQKVTVNELATIIAVSRIEISSLNSVKSIENNEKLNLFTKISHQLMKNANNKTDVEILKRIKLNVSQHTFSLIEYLRSDLALAEKFDPLLSEFFDQKKTTVKLKTQAWIIAFVDFVSQPNQLSEILFELEELKPSHKPLLRIISFKKEIHKLTLALEEKYEKVTANNAELIDNAAHNNKRTDTTNSEDAITPKNSKSDLAKSTNDKESKQQNSKQLPSHPKRETPNILPLAKNETIEITNAGIVLLNPFLPTLFKNLNLQNEKGEWESEDHQIKGIYLMHYLSCGIMEGTEDQLLLPKILVNYPLDQILPTAELAHVIEWFETNQTQITNELENILEVVHENWHPMRNCTWKGLRNDFLKRTGKLALQENLQYKLTIEPHVLDVLVPHIKWGMTMIKYSWMEQVLDVEWGK